MKNRILSIVIAVISASFLLTLALPLSFVSAQRFSTSTTTGSQSTSIFSDFVTDERVQNDAFMMGFEDYMNFVNQFTFVDLADENSTGSTLSEVEANFEAQVEGSYNMLQEDEEYLSYMYTTEGEMDAELLIYFVNGELYYAGLTNLDVNIDISELVPDASIQSWVENEILASDLMNESFRVTGISQMLYEGTFWHMILTPTGDSADAVTTDHMIIVDDFLYESYMLEFNYSLKAPQDNMIQFFAYFFGFTDEYPIAE